MKEKVDSLGFATYWWTKLIGGSVELPDCLVIPGWEYDTVYQSNPNRPEGPGRIWHYRSRFRAGVGSLRSAAKRSIETAARFGMWSVGSSRSAQATRWAIAVIITILAELWLKAAFAQ